MEPRATISAERIEPDIVIVRPSGHLDRLRGSTATVEEACPA